ncbi:MAG: YhjD/YihY/BrkB family envelope integrity protein [Phycisphaerales bacterium]
MSGKSYYRRIVEAVHAEDTQIGTLEHRVRGLAALSRVARYQLRRDRATMMAAALTYRTIFSLVPLLVLSLVVIKAFFGPAGIRDALNRFMEYTGLSQLETAAPLPEGQTAVMTNGQSLTEWIEQFVDNASTYIIDEINYSAITIAGIALFIYAALSLFLMVEQSFNTVYRARQPRDLVKRLLSYWGLLTLGFFPLMMSFAALEWLRQQGQVLDLPSWLAWISWTSSHLASIGITWLIFACIYKAVPNTRVHIRPALIGAGVTAFLWEIAKGGLSFFVGGVMSSQTAVYGSLAVVPVFMLWVYVTWLIVLFGLQIARISQTVGAEGALRMSMEMDDRPVFISPAGAVVLMRDIGARYAEGEAADIEGAGERCGLPEHVVARLLEALQEAELVRSVTSPDDEGERYVPARPIESIRTSEVYRAVEKLYQSRHAMEEERKLRKLLGDTPILLRQPATAEAAT